MLKFDNRHVLGTVSASTIDSLVPEANQALQTVHSGNGAGADFLGWTDLPTRLDDDLMARLEQTAKDLRGLCRQVVCIGIGGSYLGAKAVIEALSDPFESQPRVLFAGHNIGEDYLHRLMNHLRGEDFGIIVISKSGTTTEPAIAFRLLRDMLVRQMGETEANRRIVAVTDARRGALRQMADKQGWRTFVIDDNVGGRFSVLTPVGLLPIAVAGIDIRALVAGARRMMEATSKPGTDNPAEMYAVTRNALYRAGKKTEILVNYNPALHYFGEWWKQLYGESEGKDHRGIFPAAVDFSTDLHSMGQWIQDGERTIFETVISVLHPDHEVTIPSDEQDLDGLNYLAGKRVDQVNKMAELGTQLAHVDGGVPNMRITVDRLDADALGQLIYFFEKACGISGYLLGVNPFNQPGVEAYKRNMFALLAKPGHEEDTAAIRARVDADK